MNFASIAVKKWTDMKLDVFKMRKPQSTFEEKESFMNEIFFSYALHGIVCTSVCSLFTVYILFRHMVHKFKMIRLWQTLVLLSSLKKFILFQKTRGVSVKKTSF